MPKETGHDESGICPSWSPNEFASECGNGKNCHESNICVFGSENGTKNASCSGDFFEIEIGCGSGNESENHDGDDGDGCSCESG